MKNCDHNSKRGQRGYTLMELMVVLALIAIAAALVMPSFARGYGSLELRLAASSISTAFKMARTHSVYESRTYQVLFSPEENRERNLYIVREDGKTVDHVTIPGGIRMQVEQKGIWSEDVQPVHFFADGHAESLRLDLANERGLHMQLALNPFSGRSQVTQVYRDGESVAGGVPSAASGDVTVIQGGKQ